MLSRLGETTLGEWSDAAVDDQTVITPALSIPLILSILSSVSSLPGFLIASSKMPMTWIASILTPFVVLVLVVCGQRAVFV